VSRSKWKFLQISYNDIYSYINDYKLIPEKQGKQIITQKNLKTTLNNLNYKHSYNIPYRNSILVRKFNRFCISKKLGHFVLTKKPFHFRSKKKR
jgi:hypothetical protein